MLRQGGRCSTVLAVGAVSAAPPATCHFLTSSCWVQAGAELCSASPVPFPSVLQPRVVVLLIGTNDLGTMAYKRGWTGGVEKKLRAAAPGVASR